MTQPSAPMGSFPSDLGETIFRAMKAAAWERAKGELRALVGIKGSIPAAVKDGSAQYDWEGLSRRVEAFIVEVEEAGLHE